MNSTDIIRQQAHADGTELPDSFIKFLVASRAALSQDIVFQYGKVIFTVDPADGMVHLYSAGVGAKLLRAYTHFMQDVWKRTDLDRLTAPARNQGLIDLAQKFGWQVEGEEHGFTILTIRRPE